MAASSNRSEVFELVLSYCEDKKIAEFSMEELEEVLRNLKNNISRDPEGLVNEIFKDGTIGRNLKLSLLRVMNLCKAERMIPKEMLKTNITTIPKKGSPLILES